MKEPRPKSMLGDLPEKLWHSIAKDEALSFLKSDLRHGLTLQEVDLRLKQFGPNQLAQSAGRSLWSRISGQFNNLLILVLIAAAVITFALGHLLDSAVILGVVILNALIGFIQEGKAESALEKIRLMLSATALVVREGTRREISAQDLVPGDIVEMAAGDRVPADIRLLKTVNFSTQEAALTGESLGVEKMPQPVEEKAALGDRFSMAYSGTIVITGQAHGVVVATGMQTELGRISGILQSVQTLATPLTQKMERFSKWLSVAIVLVSAITFGLGYWLRGYSASEMFMAAVGIAVAAIPEGLPAIMTITLAIGVQRMAGRKAIIRKLPVVEALGSVTVICSDKTGTLTRNEMAVQRVITADLNASVSGSGYAPKGEFSIALKAIDPQVFPVLMQLGRASMLCNDSVLSFTDDEWTISGDPTEGALHTFAQKMGLHPASLQAAYPRQDILPFDSSYQFMATAHATPDGEQVVFLKGAPERVLGLCQTVALDVQASPIDLTKWTHEMHELAKQGMRVLAIADRPRPADMSAALSLSEVQQGGFRLLGLVGMTDPPREEVIAAIARCHSAGITVKMITGDHIATAKAIGESIGIGPAHRTEPLRAMAGQEIQSLSDEELILAVKQTDVFARATPEHKLRLVQALQTLGHVVAMTGDGVNDAPALKRADVGIAMGRKGTEAAKEASEMVLADDNFASIAAAIEEGRTVFDNIRKAIVFILPTNGGEAGMLMVAIAFGLTLPITAVQILWVNMVTAVTLALAISFERAEHDIMRKPPRPPQQSLVRPFLIWRIAFVSILLIAGCLGLFLWEISRGVSIEAARTAAVNALVIGEIAYLFNSRHLTHSVINLEGLLGNPKALWAVAVLMVVQLFFTYLPVMQSLFGTAALDGQAWAQILVFGISLFLVVEAEKKYISTRKSKHRHANNQ